MNSFNSELNLQINRECRQDKSGEHADDSFFDILSDNLYQDKPICADLNHLQYPLIIWCKGCQKAFCQKCVVEHSTKTFPNTHALIELSSLRGEVQSEAQNLYQKFEKVLNNLELEFNLSKHQKDAISLLDHYEQALADQVRQYFSQVKQNLITLTSNNENIQQMEVLQQSVQQCMSDLQSYFSHSLNDVEVYQYYQSNYHQELNKITDKVNSFIEKAKRDYLRPNFKIREEFLQEIPYHLTNYLTISLENEALSVVPRRRQTVPFQSEKGTPMVKHPNQKRLSTVINSNNMNQNLNLFQQDQVLNHNYLELMEMRQARLVTQIDETVEISKKIVNIESSKIKYLHCLIDSQKLLLHDIQLKNNQLITFPESAQIPINPETLITSGLTLYITGGLLDSKPQKKVFKFSNNQGLSRIHDMPMELCYHSVVFIKGYLYVIGGKGLEGRSNRCFRYAENNQVWEQIASLNQARSHHGSCVFETEDYYNIYAFFGLNQSGQILSSIERYNQNERKWQILQIKNMSPGLAYIKPAVIQLDQYYIFIFAGLFKGYHLQQSNKGLLLNVNTDALDNLGQLLPALGSVTGQPISFKDSIYSLHHCPGQRIPQYSEFPDVFQIVSISDSSAKIDEIINCRFLSLRKI